MKNLPKISDISFSLQSGVARESVGGNTYGDDVSGRKGQDITFLKILPSLS